METCIFCKITKGQADASVVYEDDRCTAFMDIQPINAGHVLIVPKTHVESFQDLDEDLAGHLFKVATRINRAIRKSGVECEGINYFAADGEAAFQEIFHAHLHVFPRWRGDRFRLKFSDTYLKKPAREELDRIAGRISNVF